MLYSVVLLWSGVSLDLDNSISYLYILYNFAMQRRDPPKFSITCGINHIKYLFAQIMWLHIEDCNLGYKFPCSRITAKKRKKKKKL